MLPTVGEFAGSFDTRFPDMRRRLLSLGDEPWIIAGGAVLGSLLRHPSPSFRGSDLDIFIWGTTVEDATALAERMYTALAVCAVSSPLPLPPSWDTRNAVLDAPVFLQVDGEIWSIERKPFVINLYRHRTATSVYGRSAVAVELQVQIVLHLYRSPTEVRVCPGSIRGGALVTRTLWGMGRHFRLGALA